MYAAVPRIMPSCVIAGDVMVAPVALRALRPLRDLRELREPEVQHLHRAIRADLHIARLQVAMDDAFLVRRLERLGDLPRDRKRVLQRDRAAGDDDGQIFAARPVP